LKADANPAVNALGAVYFGGVEREILVFHLGYYESGQPM